MDTDTLPYPAAETACADKQCDRPAWLSCPEGFCLFHSPYNGRLDAAARIVWETARRMAEAGDCDFRGWHFPDDPDFDLLRRKGGFYGATFSGDAEFEGATFSGQAWFEDATFSGNAEFEDATFSGNAWFDGAKFSRNAWFGGATFSKIAAFQDATFSGQVWFRRATFSGRAWFGGATFSGYTWFDGATFSGLVLFDDATFSRGAWFDGATFEGTAGFDRTQFNADALFESVRFAADAGFNSSRFAPGCNIVFNTSPPRPFSHPRHGESAYRFAKQAARERGDYTEAGRYHYAEQCAIEDRRRNESGHRPWRRAFWFWLGRFFFGRVVFGYGERPWHPLLVGLAVILAWTGLYLHLDAIGPDNPLDPAAVESHEPSVAEALYFSVVTFTTLGYGDFQPKARYRVLASVEAVLGAALLATFVVCLTRKYMR